MRVLHVIESLGRGGAEQALLNLLPALQSRGIQCSVAALWPPYTLAEPLERHGITVHRLDIRNRWSILAALFKLVRLIRRFRYGVVHAHIFFASLYVGLSRLFAGGPRRVVSYHNLAYQSYPATTPWKRLRKRLDAGVARRYVDGYLAVSSAVAEHYTDHLSLTEVAVLPNAFPLDDLVVDDNLDTATVRARYGIGIDDFLILLAGRLVPEKGHHVLLNAIDEITGAGITPRFLVVGSGPMEAALREAIVARGLSETVRLHPAVPHRELLVLFQTADLVVVPSTAEGFGLVAGEAMALGKTVLATRVGGLTDLIVHEESGYLVKPDDPAALAAGIVRLIKDADARERLGKGGSRRIQEAFTTDAIADRYATYYQRLMREPARSHG